MKNQLKGMLLATAAGAMMMMGATAFAQAPAGGPGAGAGGPPRGGGMGGPVDRASTIQRNGLADAALKLTAAQKTAIDKAADAYVAEVNKHPMTPGSPPSQDAMAARSKARETLVADVNKVLDAEQKKTWEAAQAARRPAGGPGGFGGGGPGGPGGGPGGARPPGQ